MTDDLKDIDPKIVDAVVANADAFIDADQKIDEIMAWGESELAKKEVEIKEAHGGVEEFKVAAAVIEASVAEKLKQLEAAIASRYAKQ
jgi:hypothetical protein